MMLHILGYAFQLIGALDPERDDTGALREFRPHVRFSNAKNVALHRHGAGPFCRFRIPTNLTEEGVYVLTIGDQVTYVGQCQNLSERFGPRGYGAIHPRNCFTGGQSTNCKINNLILTSVQDSKQVDLWFYALRNPSAVERELISSLAPPWNSQVIARGPRSHPVPDLERLVSTSAESDHSKPIFKLKLEKTYYRQGFFNVPVKLDRFVRTEGPIELILVGSEQRIDASINRAANLNGTARIMGGFRLRNWFQMNYQVGDTLDVDLSSFDAIRIG